MDNHSMLSVWIALALIVLIMELGTGTVYLLAISAGLFVSAIVSSFIPDVPIQLAVGSISAVLGCVFVSQIKKKESNKTLSLDTGNQVVVQAWSSYSTTNVSYRGTMWEAFTEDPDPSAGVYFIETVENNRLKLVKNK